MRVALSGQQSISFYTEVDLTQEEYDKISAMDDDEFNAAVGDYLNIEDIFEWEPMEDCEMELLEEK